MRFSARADAAEPPWPAAPPSPACAMRGAVLSPLAVTLANMTTRRGPPLWALVVTALRLMTASEPATFICCPTPPRRLACISAVRWQGGAMCRCCAWKPGVRTLVGPLAVPRPGLPTKLLCWLTGHAAALWVLVMMVRRRGVTEVSRPPSTVTASALPPSHGTRVYGAPLLIVLVLFVMVGGRPPLIHSTRDALVLPAARGATELIAMASGRLPPRCYCSLWSAPWAPLQLRTPFPMVDGWNLVLRTPRQVDVPFATWAGYGRGCPLSRTPRGLP